MSRSRTIRVRVTEGELAEIRKAAAFRAMDLSEHVRERASTIAISCGLEALAVREDVLDVLRRLLESEDARRAARDAFVKVAGGPDSGAAFDAYAVACDDHKAARAVAKEVAK